MHDGLSFYHTTYCKQWRNWRGGMGARRGRNRFSHRKWEFSLWRVRVLTLAGESSHFGDFGGWEFSLEWVRVLTVLGESFHCGEWELSPQ